MNKTGAYRHNDDGSFTAVTPVPDTSEIFVAMVHGDEGGCKFYLEPDEAKWLANQLLALAEQDEDDEQVNS